jgi:integrase
MEVIKTKDGIRYREMVWINGQAVKSPRFERKTDAREWKALQAKTKRDAKLLGDDYKYNSQITFNEFADEWFINKSQLANKTIYLYTSILKNHLKPFLNNKKLKDIKRVDGEKLIHHLKSKGHKGKGINDIVGLLKSILIDAKKLGYLISNPLEHLSKVKIDPHLEAYWTKTEINQFLLSSNFDSLYPFYIVALNTGMRKGELAGLCWDRVDFHLSQITISRTRDRSELKETTKTNLKRVIPMNNIVKTTLFNLMKKQLNPKFVFCELNGNPIDVNHVYRRFYQAQKKAEIKNLIRFHDLRHTFASQFVMANGNIFDLQKILGHTKIDMTMRYSHYSPEHLQNAMKIISFGVEDEMDVNEKVSNINSLRVN